jgi:2-amino-4-hydroxy-6-hydroxymethyldihydropteridine diphosphokinase
MGTSGQSRLVIAFIAVGSNIEPEENIALALDKLKSHVEVQATSTFYRTKPLERDNQPRFYNGVWRIRTHHSPRELKFNILRAIEDDLGRVRTGDRHASRPIDLDLILYDDAVIDEPDLRIPDRDITSRVFIAVPLVELAPDLVIPSSNEKVSSLAIARTRDGMVALTSYTELLRKKLTRSVSRDSE